MYDVGKTTMNSKNRNTEKMKWREIYIDQEIEIEREREKKKRRIEERRRTILVQDRNGEREAGNIGGRTTRKEIRLHRYHRRRGSTRMRRVFS